jgi:hypothetical protein
LSVAVVVVADRGYDSEDNHLLVREFLHAFCIIPAKIDMYQSGEHMVNTEKK